MESQIGGPIMLKKYIETMLEYMEYAENNKNNKSNKDEDSEKSYKNKKEEEEQFKQELIKISSLRFYAYLYLENLDQSKCNGVIKTLTQQKSFGNDQFPNIVMEVSKILGNHLYESNKTKLNQRNESHANKSADENDTNSIICPI